MKKFLTLTVLLLATLCLANPKLGPAGPELEKKDWMLGPWQKHLTPVIKPSARPDAVDSRNIYNMATILEDGVVRMIFRAESLAEPAKSMTGRLCLAESADGRNFTKLPDSSNPEPVLVPTEPYERMGVEDPRLVKLDDTYYLTYSAWDGKTARLCLATSRNMKNWEKHGPLFPDFAPTNGWTKSGAILPERLQSGPYQGKYIMYFGDTHIWMATSEDLLTWTADETPVFSPRPGKFDNVLVEPGPPPIRTDHGIVLIYNGAGKFRQSGDKLIYATGQILLDGKDPSRVLDRGEKPFLAVTQTWEEEGYVDNVVFAEGLVKLQDQWLLYYGGGDRVIGLAVAPAK
ncbi:MAG: glycoside hydrolase family 130 protein [Vulcanimicrobiota bacterium]